MSKGDKEDRECPYWQSEPNKEYNRDGGNGCSNPNWGTGNHGDANPDTQTERTNIQKEEDKKDINP